MVDPLAADFALIAAPDTIDFPLLICDPAGAPAVAVSALGSGLSLRKFLRATDEDRHVVAGPPCARRGALQARGDRRASMPGAAAHERREARRARRAGRARLGDAVGEQDERLARGELEGRVEQPRVGDQAQDGAGPPDVLDVALAAQDQRQRVARAADVAPRRAVELEAADRDRAVLAVSVRSAEQRAVETSEDPARAVLVAAPPCAACGGPARSARRPSRPCR